MSFQPNDPLKKARLRWSARRDPKEIAGVIGKVEGLLSGELLVARICELWPRVAGDEIAALTAVTRLNAGTLEVAVTPGPWKSQLLPLEQELKEELNRRLGGSQLRRIRFLEQQI
jgi:predicted nucleic acid-binding Zn ribbon protein